MKQVWLVRASSAVLAAALAAGPLRAEENVGANGMTVTVVKAVSHCFQDRVSASGVFVPKREVDLRPDRDGLMLNDLLVEKGDTVVKGQVLARLMSQGPQQESAAVKAPVDGVLIGSSAIVGAYVSADKQPEPLFRIAVNGDLEIKAEILSRSLQRIRVGMSAKIHVVGLGDIDGRVNAINEGVDAVTQLGTLRLAVPNEPHIRVGMFARVDIIGGENCGLSIPLSAVLYGPDGYVVGIVRDDRVMMRSVITGLLEGANVEVRDGLQENERVVSRAGTFLREGDRVRAVETPPAGN